MLFNELFMFDSFYRLNFFKEYMCSTTMRRAVMEKYRAELRLDYTLIPGSSLVKTENSGDAYPHSNSLPAGERTYFSSPCGRGMSRRLSGQGEGEKGNKRGMSSEKPGQKLPEGLLKQARYLRETQTETEVLLWQLLRNRQLENAKFRRQHPIEEGIILDFYCHKSKLAVEVDGAYHNDAKQQTADYERTELLSEMGIRVIRFTNEQVLEDTEAVLAQIVRALRAGAS